MNTNHAFRLLLLILALSLTLLPFAACSVAECQNCGVLSFSSTVYVSQSGATFRVCDDCLEQLVYIDK